MRLSQPRPSFRPALGLVASALLAAGCGVAVGGAAGGSGSGNTSGSSGGTSNGGSSIDPITGCVGTSSTATRQALDIFIMLDRSLSMEEGRGTTTKWGAVASALSSFVGQPMEGTSVGLGYFPIEDGSEWEGNSCTASDYAAPVVEIGPLSRTAAEIRSSIAGQQLLSGTPSSPALQGAIDHARAWAARNAGHAVVVVLATDGEPTTCDPSVADVRRIAASGLSASPSIRTFVIGIGNLANMNGIAAAGGTTSAFIVDTNGSVSSQFLQALNDIRGKAVACSYVIPAPPAGQLLDYGKVNVEYQPGGGGATARFGQVASAAACGGRTAAWHYDRTPDPSAIVLCPSTCATVEADGAASVRIVLGCGTTEGDPTSSGGTSSSGGASSGGEW